MLDDEELFWLCDHDNTEIIVAISMKHLSGADGMSGHML